MLFTEIEETGGEADLNGEKSESSVWGLLSVRRPRASQKEYRSGHPVWGSRGSLKMWAQSGLISTQPDLPFRAMKMQKQ